MNSYIERTLNEVKDKNHAQQEFIQAVTEVFCSLEKEILQNKIYEQNAILERIVEPERILIFRVPWTDDNGKIHVNRGFRVQYNSALGPYKGGLRLHPSVNLGIIKFLGFEQIFKNSLTTLPMGGAKGGSDFDPKGKTEAEVMRFCQSFMNELYRHIGPDTDVPAGDIGVGAREIGYLFGQYKKISNQWVGALTGKNLEFGGSLCRPEATGYGLIYFVNKYLYENYTSFSGKKVLISGAGNVAIYACEKAQAMGAKVLTMSDSNGCIYDKDGIDIELVKQIKEVDRQRISKYIEHKTNAEYHKDKKPWMFEADIALPCATQNEIVEEDAKQLVKNNVKLVAEGANMPTNAAAKSILKDAGIVFFPSKAANAGGVAVSGIEMSQNSARLHWTFDKVDKMLQNIMCEIYNNICDAAKSVGLEGDYIAGANIAGFRKVAKAMISQGIV